MAEKKTASAQYGVKMFVYIGAALAILGSIVALILKLTAGTTSGLFYSCSTIATAVLLIILVRISPPSQVTAPDTSATTGWSHQVILSFPEPRPRPTVPA